MSAKFKSGTQWYYIDRTGKIREFIVHSGLSPKAAEVLAEVHVVYETWDKANLALKEFNKMFTTFKDLK